MDKRDDPADIRLSNVIDMGLSFSAMLRLYEPGSKKKMHERIHSSRKQLWKAESPETFTSWHSSICGWGIENIRLQKREAFASYGQIAKTLDVVLKVAVYYCHLPDCEGSANLSRWLNAAVDTKMMGMLRRCYPNAFKRWPVTVWEVDNRESYEVIQKLVRLYIAEKRPGITPVQFDDIFWWKLNKRERLVS